MPPSPRVGDRALPRLLPVSAGLAAAPHAGHPLPRRLSRGSAREAHCHGFPEAALTLGVTVLMSWWRSCQPPPSRCCHYRQLPTRGE